MCIEIHERRATPLLARQGASRRVAPLAAHSFVARLAQGTTLGCDARRAARSERRQRGSCGIMR